MKATRTCSIEGCYEPHQARGYCATHYTRWQRHGDPTINLCPPSSPCSVDGCDGDSHAHGFCALHYHRWRKTGDPGPAGNQPRSGQASFHWKGDDVGYDSIHVRLRVQHGPARTYTCPCGEQASQWAYDHADPDEKIDPRLGLTFSTDVNHYVPMCAPCHKRLDIAWARRLGGALRTSPHHG